jgi:myo-inositol-1(or 4)-monophosphatase
VTAEQWLEVFQQAGAAVRAATVGYAGTEAGRAELARGAGGDITVEIDRRAEEAAIGVLQTAAERGARFTLVSEEIGRRPFGAELPLVFLDPIDGSLNAKQGIPLYACMLSVLDGTRVGDVLAGYVLNLVSGEEWTAARDGGAFRDGALLVPLRPARGDRLELLGVESSPPSIFRARGLIERSDKVRILGSMALSIAHTASGSFDAFICPIAARLFDMTASVLIAREAGAVFTDAGGRDIGSLEVGLERRSSLLVGATPEQHALALRLYRETASVE